MMEKNDILIDFGRRLRIARENLNLTQQELADAIDINKSMISAYENGATDPRMSILPPLADKLRVSINWLTSGENVISLGADQKKAQQIKDYIDFLEHKENK